MKLVDTNILLYAANRTCAEHARAKKWLEGQLSGNETLGLGWNVLLGFIRVSTRRGVFEVPLGPAAAMDFVDALLDAPCVTVIHPTARHAIVLRGLLEKTGTAGNLTTDAHLAALAIEHNAEVCSTDADFARFPGVRWTDPLV